MNQLDDFISFIEIWWTWNVHIVCCACLRPERVAYCGMQVSFVHTLVSIISYLVCICNVLRCTSCARNGTLLDIQDQIQKVTPLPAGMQRKVKINNFTDNRHGLIFWFHVFRICMTELRTQFPRCCPFVESLVRRHVTYHDRHQFRTTFPFFNIWKIISCFCTSRRRPHGGAGNFSLEFTEVL